MKSISALSAHSAVKGLTPFSRFLKVLTDDSIDTRYSVRRNSNPQVCVDKVRPRPHVSGDFCIRKFFYADTPSVHTCPPYTLGVSGDFCLRSPEWKFLYTLCIRIGVDARIRLFLYTLTSHYHNLLTAPLRCPDTNRIRVDGRIRFVYAKCGRRYFSIRIKKFADTIISRYVSTGPKRMR